MTEISDEILGRSQLIEATLKCIADHGPAAATVRQIAAVAGVSAGLVRHHFGGKDELLTEAYRHMNHAWLRRVKASIAAKEPDSDCDLKKALKAYFPQNDHDIQRMAIIVAYWGMASSNREIRNIQAETYTEFHKIYVSLIFTLVSSAQDADGIAMGLIGLADGLWIECCLNPQRLTHERAFDITWQFLQARLSASTGDGV